MNLLVVLIVFIALASPDTGRAQDVLEELVIIGNSEDVPRTGEVVDSEHTGSHSRINSTRLEQPGSELGSLLGSISGVQQRQSGGFGTYSTVTVRAGSAPQTAVFLDGILLNSGGVPVIDFSTLEILNLGAVDIYKGSAPLQLGHAGIGGAVNLNTTVAKSDSGPTIRFGAGNFSQATVSAAHQISNGKWDWLGSASHQQSENDYPFLHDNLTPLNSTDDQIEKRRNNQVSRNAILMKGGHQSSESTRTDALVQIAEREQGVPTRRNSPLNDASYETFDSQLQLSRTIDQWRNWNTRHSFYWHQSDSVYDNTNDQNRSGAQRNSVDTSTLGIKTYWETFIASGTFGLSIDWREETLDGAEESFNLDDAFVETKTDSAQRSLLLATAHLALMNKSDTLLITPAIRWQQSRREGITNSIGVAREQQEVREAELGVQLGASLTLSPLWTLNANAGNYFREPSFGELYGSTGLLNGNPTLVAEDGINLDVSLVFNSDTLDFEATLFHSLRDELIVTTYNSLGIGRTANTGEARVTGLELSASWSPSSVWKINANATLQNPRNLDPRQSFSGKLLPTEARQAAFARIQYTPSSVAYWYEWQVTRNMFYDSGNSLPAADTSVHNFGVNLKRGAWKFAARLQNASDKNIEDFGGFPKTGRIFSIAVTRYL